MTYPNLASVRRPVSLPDLPDRKFSLFDDEQVRASDEEDDFEAISRTL